MQRRNFLIMSLAAASGMSAWAAGTPVKIYRDPSCGCCDRYAQYLGSRGFAVELIDTTDAAPIYREHEIPAGLEGCHTAVIGNYVFEGLIPAEYIRQVINRRLPVRGLSVPGMPVGAPGMPGAKKGPINVYALDSTSPPRIFATF